MYKMIRSLFAAALAGFLVGTPIGLTAGFWPSSSDSVFANPVPLTTGQVTITDYNVATNATTTISANSDRVFLEVCRSTGNPTGVLWYEFGTVDITTSSFIVASSTNSTNGADRCFTTNKGGMVWQGAIQMKAVTATVNVRVREFTK